MKALIIMLLFFAFVSTKSIAETISGTIIGIEPDGNEKTLVGAKLQWINSSIGTLSNEKGQFLLQKNEEHMLVVSYVGFVKDTFHIENQTKNLVLKLKAGYTTETMTVSASKPTLIVDNSQIIKSEVITTEGLQKAACCNLSESFETNSSVDVSVSDAVTGAKQIELLGLAGRYTQMLTERIPNFYGLASSFGMSYVPGTWIESISIAKGVSDVVSGYEAHTGQINIEYKKPAIADKLFVNMYASNMNRVEGNIDYTHNVTENISTILFLSAADMSSKWDKNNDEFLDAPLFRNFNIFNRWFFDYGDFRSQVSFQALNENRENGQLSYFENRNNGFGVDINTERYSGFAKASYEFDKEWLCNVGNILSYSNHIQQSQYGLRNYDATHQSVFYNLVGETKEISELFKMKGGMSIRYEEYDETFADTSSLFIENIYGGFLEYAFTGINDLVIVAASRYDNHNVYGNIFTPRFHLKYDFSENTVFRASAGRGFRVARIFADNQSMMVSNREFMIELDLKPEESWNYGFNFTTNFDVFGRNLRLGLDAYRTQFLNQIIVDNDHPGQVFFYNLDGESYSNSVQVDLTYELIEKLNISASYRFNDVMQTMDGELRQKALIARHRAFLNIEFEHGDFNSEWKYDLTFTYNGGGRLPFNDQLPIDLQKGDNFPAFFNILGQVSKKFGDFEAYLGIENIGNFRQLDPIWAAGDANSPYFDASNIWGPIFGRMYYVGFRWEFD